MKLKHLFHTLSWSDIESVYNSFNHTFNTPSLQKSFEEIKAVPPTRHSTHTLLLQLDKWGRYEVMAYTQSDQLESITLLPWEYVLNMKIDDTIINSYSPSLIVAMSLLDMTYFGYTHEEREITIRRLLTDAQD